MSVWRVGRKLGVTLYRDEVFVGHVCSATVAAEIVETMNRVGRLLDEVRVETARERSPRGMWACCGAPLADHPLDWCPEAEPGDAQRRSEATPQKDLSEDIDVEHFGTPGQVWTSARRRVLDDIAAECARRGCTDTHSNLDHDLSRVDPYDTTKGGIA